MPKPSVFVSRRWPEAVEAKLAANYEVTFNTEDKPLGVDEFRSALKSHDAVLPTVTDTLGPEVFEVDSIQTKILGNFGVGFSHIDETAVKAAGLIVTNTPGVLSECTADIAMTLMLMVARRAGEGEREVRAGEWTGWRPTHLIGNKVSGKTLGIIGFGRIGQKMAQRAHFGFDMKILVQNRSPIKQEILDHYNAVQIDTVDELLPQCDFVSLHCPGGAANRHLINAKRLETMKSNAFLINTARGEVVDDEALAKALQQNLIAGAGLDVFDGEPKINSGLFKCENAVLLPHLGSATRETREAMGFRVLDNLDDFFAGRQPQDRVI